MSDDDIDWWALSNGLSTVMPDGTLIHGADDMTDRYVPNGTPLTPYEQELLTILMEECAEVIVAASKLKRFGRENRPGPDKEDNCTYLGLEVGDLQEMIDRVIETGLITNEAISAGMTRKAGRLHHFMQTEPT